MGFKQTREKPLKVVVVDGIRWLQHPKTGYYSASEWHYRKGGRHPQLHVYIWEREHHQKVPDGYDVHHKDLNKENNSPDNLVAMPRLEHLKLHGMLMTEERKELSRKFLREKAQPEARKWHKSKEGKSWHSKHAVEMGFGYHKDVECICIYCGKSFIGKEFRGHTKSKFCCNAHKSAWRRKMHLDDISKVCVVCGKRFMTNKHKQAKTCSPECWMKICGRPKNYKCQRQATREKPQ